MAEVARCAVTLILLTFFAEPQTARAGNDPSTPRRSTANLREQLPRIAPRRPAEAERSFKTLGGFQMQLIAAEPLIASPVAIAYDADNRAYVVEMRDYPYPTKPGIPLLGRVRLLSDADGDGKFDQSTVFAEGLNWPTGLACFDGGVYVLAPPDLWYLKDTDGDGKADVREKVFAGFGVYNVQALANNLQWGADHWIYGSTAGNGAEIRSQGAGVRNQGSGVRRQETGERKEAKGRANVDKPLVLRGRDFRFHPVTRKIEAIAGTAQFGNTFDDFGNRFVCSNRDPALHIALPLQYFSRNPYLPVSRLIQNMAVEGSTTPLDVFQVSPIEPWREVRTRRYHEEKRNYPRSEMVPSGVFTSATGITIYRSGAYPREYYGNMFVGNVAGNLIHRRSLKPNGATFVATRRDQKAELVASADNWFRPCNFVNAPDGTLHVLDIYRETVEHPWSIPDDIKSHLDLESGREMGRIYRLAPPAFKVPRPAQLGKADTAQLAAALESPHGWWRDTASRLLFERRDQAAIEPIRALGRLSKSAATRFAALHLLSSLEALNDADLAAALGDPAGPLREHAIRLAERSPSPRDRVLALSGDPDPRVRFQLALSIGSMADPRAIAALAAIAAQDVADPWTRTAVLSSAPENAAPLLCRLSAALNSTDGTVEGRGELLRQLALIVGARNRQTEIDAVLAAAVGDRAAASREIVIGLGDGMRRARRTLAELTANPSAPGAMLVATIFERAVSDARRSSTPLPARLQAIELLGYGRFEKSSPPLAALLDARQPAEVQAAAVRAMAALADDRVAGIILDRWPTLTPAVRGEAIETLLSRLQWLVPLLEAVSERKVDAGEIPPTRAAQLLKHSNVEIRRRAVQALGSAAIGPRDAVLAQYQSALKQAGERARGAKVFERECASCHRVGGRGFEVGPNLAEARGRSPNLLLLAILDPNREVAPNHTEYLAAVDDGRIVSGLIASESAASVTLKRAQGAADVILRQNLQQLTATGKSLMPEGLEKKITPAEMADLLAFLRALPR